MLNHHRQTSCYTLEKGSSSFGNQESVTFSLVSSKTLVSRAEVITVDLEHADENFHACGICNVFTAPSWRRQNYGKQMVKVATQYILQSKADIGIIFCNPQLQSFYATSGWEFLNYSITRVGTVDHYHQYADNKMMLFISKKGQEMRFSFISQPLYIDHLW